MNRIIIIGNGFDLAHGLKTKYENFLEWLELDILTNHDSQEFFEKVCLIKPDPYNGSELKSQHFFKNYNSERFKTLKSLMTECKGCKFVYKNKFLEHIINKQNLKKWVDIEEEYFKKLKEHFQNYVKIENIDPVTKLNQDFIQIKDNLEEYLCGENKKAITIKENLKTSITRQFFLNDKISTQPTDLERILFLNFNYTSFEKHYEIPFMRHSDNSPYVPPYTQTIHIHGELKNDENPIIFGYGNENTEAYKEIENINRNEFLENMKSFKYSNVSKYNELMIFVKSAPYQIYIWGHSCGNSDGTLLKELFENKNCFSIKPFYHVQKDGNDNYSDIVMNISRHFSNNTVFRDKVMNKEFCEELK